MIQKLLIFGRHLGAMDSSNGRRNLHQVIIMFKLTFTILRRQNFNSKIKITLMKSLPSRSSAAKNQKFKASSNRLNQQLKITFSKCLLDFQPRIFHQTPSMSHNVTSIWEMKSQESHRLVTSKGRPTSNLWRWLSSKVKQYSRSSIFDSAIWYTF